VRAHASLLLLALSAGCGQSAAEYGRSLFDDPSLSDAKSNPFRCSTCHETVAQPSTHKPGYTLFDSAVRAAWWGGNEITLLDATNQCVTQFMRGRALTASDEKGRALFVYLESISKDASAPTLPFTIVPNIVDVPSGDPAAGEQVWKSSCANCHGDPETGKGRISDVASLVPQDSLQAHGTDPMTGARPVVIEKVRHGKFFNISGNMPPFSLEALSAEQLGQLLGYLEMFGLPKSATTH
jgi:thiosulfate dehydrogenase